MQANYTGTSGQATADVPDILILQLRNHGKSLNNNYTPELVQMVIVMVQSVSHTFHYSFLPAM